MSIVELKAKVYDFLGQIEYCQNEIGIINKQIVYLNEFKNTPTQPPITNQGTQENNPTASESKS
jgi:hypothetical protein